MKRAHYNNTKERVVLKRQSGIAVVEFAIGVLLLIFLLLITAEVGRAFFSYNTLTKSVRGGARYISVESTNGAGVVIISAAEESNTQNIVVHGNPAGSGFPVLPNFVAANVTVERASPPGGGGVYLRVSANYNYQSLFGSLRIPGFSEIDLSFNMFAASTMRAQL